MNMERSRRYIVDGKQEVAELHIQNVVIHIFKKEYSLKQ